MLKLVKDNLPEPNFNSHENQLLKNSPTLSSLKYLTILIDKGFDIINIALLLCLIFTSLTGFTFFILLIFSFIIELVLWELPVSNNTVKKIINILLPWENNLLAKLSKKGYLSLRNFRELFKARKKFELTQIINHKGN